MTPPRLRQTLASLAAVAVLGAGLSACSSASDAAGAVGDPVAGGTLEVYDPVEYGAWQITNTLWSNSNVTDNLVDRLTWQDPETGEIKPWLAESWEISEDELSYTFHLRDGVTFSNGEPVDAAIVAANYDQHGYGDEALGVAPDQFFTGYAGSEVVDPLTVTINFTEPNAGFLQVTSIYRSGILAQSYLDLDWNAKGQAENLIGSGPFVVADVEGTTGITLARRDGYDWAPTGAAHDGEAYLDEIVFTSVPEASTRVGALQSGEAHVARNIAPYDEETVTAAGGQLLAVPVQGQVNKLSISLGADAPTRELAVRQALQAATDREEINATVLSDSYGIPTSSLVASTPGHGDASSYLETDTARAEELLEDAGWVEGSDGIREKDGERLSFTLYVTPYYQVSQAVLELLQAQWEEVGVETELQTPSLTEYEALLADDPQAVVFQQGQLSRADVDVLRTAFDSTAQDTTRATTPDATLDELVRAQALVFDPTERQAAVQAVEDHVFENALIIPLYEETQVFGLAPSVQGFGTEAVARAWYYDTWINE
ncbi:ABC transporter substrate-binding protein [Nocardioides zeae]|uniref:Peptide/nickel transport system substrate-binding protein n=1 Tax=Nocardioides zeae TaxID=1457234 RepID=A0AAJ1X2G7_9ACTN|nr:ABC transporter substrate-binding protein [Nocardioides zeae]MDQ1105259.1 peptide/nickel transport system substrate-binding protein [Nocardioides zeae]